MPARSPHPANDRWCDVEGSHVSLFCWVEQVTESPERAALPSRLHQQGQVLGRGHHHGYVRFKGDSQLVSVSSRLLRLLPDALGGW